MVGEKIRSVSSHFIKLVVSFYTPFSHDSAIRYPRALLILFLSIVLHATLVPLSSYSHRHSYMSPQMIGFIILAFCALLLSIQSMLYISYFSLTFYLSNFIFTICFLTLLVMPCYTMPHPTQSFRPSILKLLTHNTWDPRVSDTPREIEVKKLTLFFSIFAGRWRE